MSYISIGKYIFFKKTIRIIYQQFSIEYLQYEPLRFYPREAERKLFMRPFQNWLFWRDL